MSKRIATPSRPRYVVRSWSFLTGQMVTRDCGEIYAYERTDERAGVLEFAATLNSLDSRKDAPRAYALAILSNGTRVRIGGGA